MPKAVSDFLVGIFCVMLVIALIFGLVWAVDLTATHLPSVQRKPAPVERPETADTAGSLRRLEAKVDRLVEKFADHEEHTEKLCGPK